jgi:two-component system, OmpR family, response regulator
MRPEREKILCAEAEHDLCELLSVFLDHESFDVEWAKTLATARQLSKSEHFALYLIDEQYPDGTGLDFIREIRESGSGIPIIYQSAYSFPEYIQEGLDAGASVYRIKPVDMDELVATTSGL